MIVGPLTFRGVLLDDLRYMWMLDTGNFGPELAAGIMQYGSTSNFVIDANKPSGAIDLWLYDQNAPLDGVRAYLNYGGTFTGDISGLTDTQATQLALCAFKLDIGDPDEHVVPIVDTSGPGQSTGYLVTRDGQGGILGNVNIYFRMIKASADGHSYRSAPFSITSDGDGLLQAGFNRGSTYQAKRCEGFETRDDHDWIDFIVPDDDSFALPAVLGDP